MLNLKKDGVRKICYPGPPVYPIEADWHEELKVKAFTPLRGPSERDSLSKERVVS